MSLSSYIRYIYWIIVCVVLAAQLCPTLCYPIDGRQPGSSVHEICQARILLLLLSHFSRVCVWPHKWQLTRHRRPWDSPGKNTGVACHFLLQCMKVKSESEVTWPCLTLSDLMRSLPGSSIHSIFQAKILEWVAIAFSILIPSEF